MEEKNKQAKASKKAMAKDQEAHAKAEQRAYGGKFPLLLENWNLPFSLENLTRVTDQKLHEEFVAAKADSLIATCEQLVATLTARASTSKDARFEPTLLSVIGIRAINALAHLASQGNDAAAQGLLRIAWLGTGRLNSVAGDMPSLFNPIARDRLDWPVLYSPHPYFGSDVIKLQQILDIGSDFQIHLLTQRKNWDQKFDLSLPQNEIALRVLGLLVRTRSTPQSVLEESSRWADEARTLPPFKAETAPAWAKVGWKAVLAAYGMKPEVDPYFSKIGKSIPEERRTPSVVRARIGALVRGAIRKFCPPAGSTK